MARDRNKLEGRVKQGRFTSKQMKRWVLTPDIVSLSLFQRSNPIATNRVDVPVDVVDNLLVSRSVTKQYV